MTKSIAKKSTTGSLPHAVPLAITPTFSPWTHTSDDSYIYQLSLVLVTATVSYIILGWKISTTNWHRWLTRCRGVLDVDGQKERLVNVKNTRAHTRTQMHAHIFAPGTYIPLTYYYRENNRHPFLSHAHWKAELSSLSHFVFTDWLKWHIADWLNSRLFETSNIDHAIRVVRLRTPGGTFYGWIPCTADTTRRLYSK